MQAMGCSQPMAHPVEGAVHMRSETLEFPRRIPREVQGIDPAFVHIAPEKKREVVRTAWKRSSARRRSGAW